MDRRPASANTGSSSRGTLGIKPALFCVLLLSVGLGCALLLWSARDRTSLFSFGVLSYMEQGDAIAAQVILSNKSSSSVTFDPWNFPKPALRVIAETTKGKATYEMSYNALVGFSVCPKGSAVFTIRLPRDTVRWQVSGLVQAATPKRRFLQALRQRSPPKVSNWLLRRLPPDIEVKSGIFKVPSALIEGPPHENTLQPVPAYAWRGFPSHAMNDEVNHRANPVRGCGSAISRLCQTLTWSSGCS